MNAGDHFYTASTSQRDAAIAEGYVLERTEGYASASGSDPACACLRRLHRTYSIGLGDRALFSWGGRVGEGMCKWTTCTRR